MRILSVGEMVIDFLPGTEKASYIRKAGGAPANVAIAMARQGIDSSFCGLMGNDDFGRFLLQTLKDENVEPCIKDLTDDAITTMAFVSLDETGNRSFTFARKPGADMLLTRDMIKDEFIDSADVVHAGSCSMSKNPAADATVYAMEQAHEKGKIVSYDVNYRNLMWGDDRDAASDAVCEILPLVDFLKISDEEADMIGGEESFDKLMKDNRIALIIETLGSKGAKCFFDGKVLEVEALKAECVDSCGAGDAFWGGCLSYLLKNGVKCPKDLNQELIIEAMKCGNIAGWLCVQKKGAIESLPTASEVEKYRGEFYIG